MKAQHATSQPQPTTKSSMQTVLNKAWPQILAWPKVVIELVKQPKTVITTLPTKGEWEPVLIYLAAASLVVGITSFLSIVGFSFGLGVRSLIVSIISGMLSVPVQAFILNFVLGILGKEPGYYRTLYFLSLLSLITATGAALAFLVDSSVAYLVMLISLYPIYHFIVEVSGLTKEKALACIAVIYLVSIGMSNGLSSFWLWR